ncbi:MAG: lytic transglycosylase domain-containing protein [Candidatus Solibacter usitatus]|nr:lytic transglycosylase domain-containing protein [Candidatus Solibacter usitatus]
MLVASFALPAAAAEPALRLTTTVRADARTGRLVRTSVVAPRAIQPTVQTRTLAPVVVPPVLVDGGLRKDPPASAGLGEIIEQTARDNSVDPLLVHSVIRVESNYDPLAVSPKGAEGLMQLIPATARRFGAANSFDVRENIAAGVKYLKYLQDMFKDDRLALAAYNAGEGAVMKYRDVPPYRETERYVYKVGRTYGDARRRQAAAPPVQKPPEPAAAPAEIKPEPLRQLDVATDAEGRVVLKTR